MVAGKEEEGNLNPVRMLVELLPLLMDHFCVISIALDQIPHHDVKVGMEMTDFVHCAVEDRQFLSPPPVLSPMIANVNVSLSCGNDLLMPGASLISSPLFPYGEKSCTIPSFASSQ